MAKVASDMSMSFDGYIAGPNDNVELPLGEGGERLHQWVYELASWRERHGLAGGKTDRPQTTPEGDNRPPRQRCFIDKIRTGSAPRRGAIRARVASAE